MKTILPLLYLLFSFATTYSQSILEWSPNYQLQFGDFQSPESEINADLSSYTIFSGANMDFSFSMSSVEFMFTKNFNSKAKTIFNRNAAIITAPDSTIMQQLVNCGQYTFDLTELYTRKFRQQMNEKKGVFSDFSFFQPIFMELQEELNNENSRVLKAANLGKEVALLQMEHQKVRAQIEELSDFCFSCKPPKRKK